MTASSAHRPRLLTDTWVCRDSSGLLHVAKIQRCFSDRDALTQMQGCTACHPRVQPCMIPLGDWHGRKLPPFSIGDRDGHAGFTLIEYWIREAPTCVTCAVTARPG